MVQVWCNGHFKGFWTGKGTRGSFPENLSRPNHP